MELFWPLVSATLLNPLINHSVGWKQSVNFSANSFSKSYSEPCGPIKEMKVLEVSLLMNGAGKELKDNGKTPAGKRKSLQFAKDFTHASSIE